MKILKIVKSITAIAVIFSLVVITGSTATLLGKPQVKTAYGSSSTTEFTNSGGTPVTDFNIGDDIYVKVTDDDENDNPATPQSVAVTVTSVVGDSEDLTLDETGNNTGVFINTSAINSALFINPVNSNDGTLEIAEGGSMTVSYVDPDPASINTYLPARTYEGGHIDDKDNLDDPDVTGGPDERPSICDSTPLTRYDGFNSTWNPNDPSNSGYIPYAKSLWDIFDNGAPEDAWIDASISVDVDSAPGNVALPLISANDGPALDPTGSALKIPQSPKDVLDPLDPTKNKGWESNHAILDTANYEKTKNCSGWNIFEFEFDITEDPTDIAKIDLLWNGFHTLNDEILLEQFIEDWNAKYPGNLINSPSHKNDSYFILYNSNSVQWESIDENVISLPNASNDANSKATFEDYTYTAHNDPKEVPGHNEAYSPPQEDLKSSDPTDVTLSDDINLSGARTTNIQNYFNGNTLKALVTEYDQFSEDLRTDDQVGSLFTDYIELQVTTAEDSSQDTLENLGEAEPYCGDGNLDSGEECDDGNTADGDGCSSECTTEEDGDGEPGLATIHGKVYNDVNQNGTLDSGEVGINGVTVTLQDDNNNALETEQTDVNGDFSFSDLDPDTYALRETDPEGYSSSTPNNIGNIVLAANDSSYHLFGDYTTTDDGDDNGDGTTTSTTTTTTATPTASSLPTTGPGDNPYPLFALLALVPLMASGYAFYRYKRK